MISWIIIVVLVIIGLFVIKLNHLKHRFFIIMLILLALFLYTSMNAVTQKNELDLKSSSGIFSAIKIYSGWLANGFQNLKSLTGKAINLNWGSTNGTFLDKEKESETKNTGTRSRRR